VSDNAVPSGASLAVDALLRVAELFDDVEMRSRASYVVETLAPSMGRYPLAFGYMLSNADAIVHGITEVVFAGDQGSNIHESLRVAAETEYVPARVTAAVTQSTPRDKALFVGRDSMGGPAAFVCRNYACERPVSTGQELRDLLAASKPPL
jgi:uncharacterized protein YyaL (SSP411 family)